MSRTRVLWTRVLRTRVLRTRVLRTRVLRDWGGTDLGPRERVLWTVESGPGRPIDFEHVEGLAVSNGGVIIAGYGAPGGAVFMSWIARHSTADGAHDPNFGDQGVVPDRSRGSSATIVAGGAIWRLATAYFASEPQAPSIVLERRSITGGSTLTLAQITAPEEYLPGLVSDGSALFLSLSSRFGASETIIEKRRSSDAMLETMFGNSGRLVLPSRGAIEVAAGALYRHARPEAGFTSWRLEKMSAADGAPNWAVDITQATSGESLSADPSAVYLSMIDSAGWLRVEKRSTATGALDPSFGNQGVVLSSRAPNRVGKMIIDGNRLLITKTSSTGTDESFWQIEARSTIDGSLDTTFGEAGIVTSARMAGIRTPTAIAVDGADIYVGVSAHYSSLAGEAYLSKIGR